MEHLPVKTQLDANFTKGSRRISYPFIYLPKYGEELPVVVRCLEIGTIPLVLSNNGSLLQVGSCILSAVELLKLLRVYKFEMVLSETDRRVISTVDEMLEVVAWILSV